MGDGRDRLLDGPLSGCIRSPVRQLSGMPIGDEQRAELAARLARGAGSRGVVCLGCQLAGTRVEAQGLITLSRPPLENVCIEPERLLLVAVPYHSRVGDLELFAATGVPEVWLYGPEWIESRGQPIGARYRRRSLVLPGEKVRLAGLPGVTVVPLPSG